MSIRGEEVHGEISSADASGGVALTLYRADKTARTLATSEVLVITDIVASWSSAGSFAFVSNTDTAGKRIFKATVGALGGMTIPLRAPHYCPIGVMPKLIAAAGQVDIQIQGYILRGYNSVA